MRNFTLMISTN